MKFLASKDSADAIKVKILSWHILVNTQLPLFMKPTNLILDTQICGKANAEEEEVYHLGKQQKQLTQLFEVFLAQLSSSRNGLRLHNIYPLYSSQLAKLSLCLCF